MSERLDHRRPLWALDLVGPLADGSELIVSRIHHAMADGISCLRFLDEVLWDRSDAAGESKRPGGLAGRGRLARPRAAPASRRRCCASSGIARAGLGARPPDRLGARARVHDRPARRPAGDRRVAAHARDGQRRAAGLGLGRAARLARCRRRAGRPAARADPGQPPPSRRGAGRALEPRLVPERRPAAGRARPARPARPDQRRDRRTEEPGDAQELYDLFHALARCRRSSARCGTGARARTSSASRSPTCRDRGASWPFSGGRSSASARSPSPRSAMRCGSRRSPARARSASGSAPIPRRSPGIAELAEAIGDSITELREAAIG